MVLVTRYGWLYIISQLTVYHCFSGILTFCTRKRRLCKSNIETTLSLPVPVISIQTPVTEWVLKKTKILTGKLLPAAHEAVMPGSDFFLNVDMLWGCIATVGDWWLYFNWCRQRRKFWPSRRRKTTPWGWGPTCPSHCCQRKRRTRNWQHCSPTRHLTVSIIYRL